MAESDISLMKKITLFVFLYIFTIELIVGHGMKEDIVNSVYPDIIPAISRSTEVLFIDVFNALGGFDLQKLNDFILEGQEAVWPHDGCHPNDFGYFDIANEISKSIFATDFHFY